MPKSSSLPKSLHNTANSTPPNPLTSLVKQNERVRVFVSDPATNPPWLLLEGDARDGLASIESESVDCVVTSPPYYWQRDYGIDGQIGHEATIDGYVDAIQEVFRPLRRVLKKTGTVFLNLGDTYYSAKGRPHGKDDKHKGRMLARKKLRAVDGPGLGLPRKSLIGIPWRVAMALQKDGWTLRSDIIWKRPGTMPEPTAQDRPWNTLEHVFLFSNSPKYYFHREGLEGEEDIWHIAARPDNPGSHFAPFPSALVERCLQCGCPPGGVVLDPFAGSGTTLFAARESNRPSLGIELSREYCEFMVKRLSETPGKSARAMNGARVRGAGANGILIDVGEPIHVHQH